LFVLSNTNTISLTFFPAVPSQLTVVPLSFHLHHVRHHPRGNFFHIAAILRRRSIPRLHLQFFVRLDSQLQVRTVTVDHVVYSTRFVQFVDTELTPRNPFLKIRPRSAEMIARKMSYNYYQQKKFTLLGPR